LPKRKATFFATTAFVKTCLLKKIKNTIDGNKSRYGTFMYRLITAVAKAVIKKREPILLLFHFMM